MSALNRIIERGVHAAVAESFAPGGMLDDLFADELRKMALRNKQIVGRLTPTQFMWQFAFELIRVGNIAPMVAKKIAQDAMDEFMADENIKYGNRRYAWDQAAAITLAHAMEIEHWEASQ